MNAIRSKRRFLTRIPRQRSIKNTILRNSIAFTQKRKYFWQKKDPVQRKALLPRGDLVYHGADGRVWFWGPIIGTIHASAWTLQAIWQYMDPIAELGLRTLVMCAGVAWMSLIMFGFHARRAIVRIWLEEGRMVHIQTHNWFAKTRYLNVPVGCIKINARRLKAMSQSRWGYYVCEVMGKGRFFTIYKNGKFYDKEHVIKIFGDPLVSDLQYSIAETNIVNQKKKEAAENTGKPVKKKNLWKNKIPKHKY